MLAVVAESGKAAVTDIAGRLGMDPREVAARLLALSANGLPLMVGVECDPNGIRAAIANAGGWGNYPQQNAGPPMGPNMGAGPGMAPNMAPGQGMPPNAGPGSGMAPNAGPGQGMGPNAGPPSGPYPAPGPGMPNPGQPGPYPGPGQSGPGQSGPQNLGQNPGQSGPYAQPQSPPQAPPRPNYGGSGGPSASGGPSGSYPPPGSFPPPARQPGFAPPPQPAPAGARPGNTWGPPGSATWARGDQPPAPPQAPVAPQRHEGTIGETLRTEGLDGEHIAINMIEVVDPADFLFTAAGYRLREGERSVVVHTEMTNLGSAPYQTLPDLYLVLVGADGSTVSKAPVSLSSRPPHRIGVPPGETAGGHTVYVLPEEARITAVRWSARPDEDKNSLTWTVD